MKNLILTVLILFLTSGCSTLRMTDSIWCTMDPVQNRDQDGLRITSIYMFEDGKIDVYQSIMADSSLAVAPFIIAKGTYAITGNTNKEASISLNGINKNHKEFNWSGIIDLKKKSMLLIDNDSTATLYYKYGNLIIPQ